MITIIHGDDIASSRRYFVEQKNRDKDSIVFDGEKLMLSDVLQVLDGGLLFSEAKQIYIEGFFSKKKPGKEFDDIVSRIQSFKDAQIYFWEGKTLTKKYTSLFKNSEIKVFNIPKDIFTFLENIYPGNKKSLILFHNSLKTNEVELIFFMIIRQFRLLLAVSKCHLFEPEPQSRRPELVSGSSSIDEIKRLAPWQISKLQRQSHFFSCQRLKDFYKKLYEIDLAQKTGTLPLSLIQSIDLLLVSL
ncbi:MAG: hypothetical protein Q7K54_03580, partial [Candidatus Parcubacteria bacterium]|nr:hypothetical protein [Candidatus Parcubacteria bacterium]